jgi:hypothetical protein
MRSTTTVTHAVPPAEPSAPTPPASKPRARQEPAAAPEPETKEQQ